MQLNIRNSTFLYGGRYAIASVLVLLGCSAISSKAQTDNAPTEKAARGIVKGRVKLQDSKSHEGVIVRVVKTASTGVNSARARQEAEENAREVTTDNKGDFEITGLATGNYVFSFSKLGFKGFTSRRLEVLSGETLRLKLIELSKEGEPYAQIRGAVFYGAGFTLPNAQVTIERIDGGKKFKQEKLSQEGGEFGFTVKAEKATYRITAAAPGFVTATQEITIESDEVRNVALTLQQIKE
jgi:hypothetical protein